MQYVRGNIFCRANLDIPQGGRVAGHKHNFAHVSVIRRGWFLIRAGTVDGGVVRQFATPEYVELRRLQMQYQPEAVLRPVRMPDVWVSPTQEEQEDLNIGPEMTPTFRIVFISHGDQVPDGGVEIEFMPFVASDPFIDAGIAHEIVALVDGAGFVCMYSHRTPDGEVSVEPTGWEPAYG